MAPSQLRSLAAAACVCVCGAVDLHTLATVEDKHQRPFWQLGDGFEGSASDWTEYLVWLIGVIGVFYYIANPNARRNMHAVEDDAPRDAPHYTRADGRATPVSGQRSHAE